MEEKKLNFVKNGVTKLPPGFRFEPTDEEIVFRYLKCKVLGLPLPAFVIPEINLSHFDPWNLPGELEQDKYFFSNMSRPNLKATSSKGYWKSTSENRLIFSSSSTEHHLIGLRNTMVFQSSSEDASTDWTMHEYSLIFTCPQSLKSSISPSFLMMKEQWTICHIFKKKRNKRALHANPARGLKFLKLDNGSKTPSPQSPSSSSSSSSSSTLTENSNLSI